MTPEQEACDLVMDIVQRTKQGKGCKKQLKKLRELAKEHLQAHAIYDILMESINRRLEEG